MRGNVEQAFRGIGVVALLALAGGCGDEQPTASAPDAAVAGAGGGASARPIEVVRTLALSPSHYCARQQAGLFCWGANFLGQLGDGTAMDSDVPIAASMAGADIVDVALASGRTCVRRSTGEVACWGANGSGQIGDGTRDDAPAAVAALGIDQPGG
jgi:hypothetical protein